MKRKMTLSLVLTLSVLLSLVSLPSTAQGAPPQRFRFATGFVTPGVGQKLRVTVVGSADIQFYPQFYPVVGTDGSKTIRVRFVWTQYNMAPVCGGVWAVCRHTVESQGATPVVALGDDALSFDVPGTGDGANVVVESNSRDVRVNAMIIDPTGAIVSSFFIQDNTPDGETH